jgi:glycosyltransferase 2 family protein
LVNRKVLSILCRYGIGVGLLAFVVIWYWHVPTPDGGPDVGLATALKRPFHILPFLGALAIYLTGMLLTFLRWYILVRAQGLPFDLASALRLGLVGFYWSTFLPGSVGGDIIKAVAVAREQNRRTVAVATVLLDRVIGLCGLFWLVTLLGSFLHFVLAEDSHASPQAPIVLRTILLTAAGLSMGSLVVWLGMGWVSEPWAERMAQRLHRVPKIGTALAELWRAGWLYRRRGKSVSLAVGLSLLGHCCFVMSFFCAAHVFSGAELPSLAAHYLIVPVGMTWEAGIPTPGGLGGGEFGFGFLYELLGFTFVAGALARLAQRAVAWLLGLIGYVVYFRMKAVLENAAAESDVESDTVPAAPLTESTLAEPYRN